MTDLLLPPDPRDYPKDITAEKIFSEYTVVHHLDEASIFHLYPEGKPLVETGGGYIDSKMFTLWAFNRETMQRCNLGKHDGLTNFSPIELEMVRIFMDGSTLVKFRSNVRIINNQDVALMGNQMKQDALNHNFMEVAVSVLRHREKQK